MSVLTRHVCANISGGWHYKMFAKDKPIDKMSEVQFQHILQQDHLEHKPKWKRGGSVLLILTDMCSVGKHEHMQEYGNCFLHSLCNVPSHSVRSIANDECNGQMKKMTLLFWLGCIPKPRPVKWTIMAGLMWVTGSEKDVFLISIPILSRSPQIYYTQLGLPSSFLQKMWRLMGKWEKNVLVLSWPNKIWL